jgi:hypothetical protein
VVGGGVGAVEVLRPVGPKPGEESAFLKKRKSLKMKDSCIGYLEASFSLTSFRIRPIDSILLEIIDFLDYIVNIVRFRNSAIV